MKRGGGILFYGTSIELSFLIRDWGNTHFVKLPSFISSHTSGDASVDLFVVVGSGAHLICHPLITIIYLSFDVSPSLFLAYTHWIIDNRSGGDATINHKDRSVTGIWASCPGSRRMRIQYTDLYAYANDTSSISVRSFSFSPLSLSEN